MSQYTADDEAKRIDQKRLEDTTHRLSRFRKSVVPLGTCYFTIRRRYSQHSIIDE